MADRAKKRMGIRARCQRGVQADESTLGRGRSLLPQITCDRYDTRHFTGVPVIDVAAVEDDEGNVTIFAVNRDLQESVELACDLRSFGTFREVTQSVLHHDDLKAVNTENDPNRVMPVERRLCANADTIRLPAAFWNVIRLLR